MVGVYKEEHLVIPIHFRAYYDPALLRGNPKAKDEPHGILKVMSQCRFWYQAPNSDTFYTLKIGTRSLIEKLDTIEVHPNDYVRFVKVSKAEYDTYDAFELFPEYTIMYRPLWVRFEEQWLGILNVIFFIHLAIILLAIPLSSASNVASDESTRQAAMVIGSWVIFSAVALCGWLVDSLSYWRKIRRGLATPSLSVGHTA